VNRIGSRAFFMCSGLASISIPHSVTQIGDYAFFMCTGLASFTIPNSVTGIGGNAFAGCNFRSVVIPNSVTRLGEAAFQNCTNLASVTLSNAMTEIGIFTFWSCSSLVSIVIPPSVTEIGWAAFGDCSSLVSVTIPASVTAIRDEAFVACSSLKNVTVDWSVPLVIRGNANLFDYVNLNRCTLNVPAGTRALYRVATVWKDFGSITEGEVSNGEMAAASAVRVSGGNLYVSSPVSERVDIYSMAGALLYSEVKPSGETVIPAGSFSGGFLIIKGSSGWTQKVFVKQNRTHI
jgi:hypothetical protein